MAIKGKRGKAIDDAVRELCLSLPETTEVIAHGSPDFRVKGRNFASFAVNHHGDRRIALWLAAPPGAQAFHVERDPDGYFVPPYVGVRGWLGVNLDRALPWRSIAERVWEAYAVIAPPGLRKSMPPVPDIDPPTTGIAPEAFDPLSPDKVRKKLRRLASFCLSLPETTEGASFGNPVWKAGKKTFAQAWRNDGRLNFAFRVGAERQDVLTLDTRYSVPHYLGHNGWIALDVETDVNWPEVEELALTSFRHFALKRMLDAL
ncbi:MAG: MmcQ/YjbR family DNA-binding protein [Pseudomonadales bacterium]|nr:MmcQ/YjbR family DNA-binding protein [Pseudomonadales bacterium]MCP5182344.1 MmcQ/YjbR family DNA-binding protein [Pseudomonadales bacterium]